MSSIIKLPSVQFSWVKRTHTREGILSLYGITFQTSIAVLESGFLITPVNYSSTRLRTLMHPEDGLKRL